MHLEDILISSETEEEYHHTNNKLFVLIIYDIIENKRRTRFSKFLEGYGFRIQKSCFEAVLLRRIYNELLEEIPKYVSEGDSIRIYRLRGENVVTVFGENDDIVQEEVIII